MKKLTCIEKENNRYIFKDTIDGDLYYLYHKTISLNQWRFTYTENQEYIASLFGNNNAIAFVYPNNIELNEQYFVKKYVQLDDGIQLIFEVDKQEYSIITWHKFHLSKLCNLVALKSLNLQFSTKTSDKKTYLNATITRKSKSIELSDCTVLSDNTDEGVISARGIHKNGKSYSFTIKHSVLNNRSILSLADGFSCRVLGGKSEGEFVVDELHETCKVGPFTQSLEYYETESRPTKNKGGKFDRYWFSFLDEQSKINYKCSIDEWFLNIKSIDKGATYPFLIEFSANGNFNNINVIEPLFPDKPYQNEVRLTFNDDENNKPCCIDIYHIKQPTKRITFHHWIENHLTVAAQTHHSSAFNVELPIKIIKHDAKDKFNIIAQLDNAISSPYQGEIEFVEKSQSKQGERACWIFKIPDTGMQFFIYETELLHAGLADVPTGRRLNVLMQKPKLPENLSEDEECKSPYVYYKDQWRIQQLLNTRYKLSPEHQYHIESLYDWRAMMPSIYLERDQEKSHPAFFAGGLIFKCLLKNGISIAVFASKRLLEELNIRFVPKNTKAKAMIRFCPEQARYLITALDIAHFEEEPAHLSDTLLISSIDTHISWLSINHPDKTITRSRVEHLPLSIDVISAQPERFQFEVMLKRFNESYSIKKFISVKVNE